ncbi:hypothetical protein ACO2Q8_07785 [Larkinella sp. VNQ87]|uniref:hypothetical protein n=1 Tax=Larkinella sp. VNQ87 TaxID=3400921 RepID=UPI003BFB8F02
MTEPVQIFQMYPAVRMLYRTSDGWVHLTKTDAQAQARHLQDPTVTPIRRTHAQPADPNQQ